VSDQEPEEVRVFWVPEIAENPIDLTDQLAEPIAMMPEPVPIDTEGAEIEYFDDPFAFIPEGTLTEVVMMDEDGAGTVGHAEVIRGDGGTSTLRIYGIHHNPEVAE
jgi:hypothetical protein